MLWLVDRCPHVRLSLSWPKLTALDTRPAYSRLRWNFCDDVAVIVFHVGLHKTGSSAIQEALTMTPSNAPYVNAGWPDEFLEQGHFSAEWVARARAASRRKTVIVSSEDLLGPVLQVYPNAADVSRRLVEEFRDQGLRVVVYLRPQLEWVESLYTQVVQAGDDADPAEFVTGVVSNRTIYYSELIVDLRQVLQPGELSVRFMVPGRDVVHDFFSLLALGEPERRAVERPVNRSMNAWQVHAVREIRRNSDIDPVKLSHFFQGFIAPRPESPRASVLPENQQRQLIDIGREDQARLIDMLVDDIGTVTDVKAAWSASRAEPIRYAGAVEAQDVLSAEIGWALGFVLGNSPDPWSQRSLERMGHKLLHERRDIIPSLGRVVQRRWSRATGSSWS